MSRATIIQGIIENFSRLSHSSRRRHHMRSHHFKDVGLSPAQIGILHAVGHHRRITTNHIAEFMGVSKSAISQLSESLVQDGLLERKTDHRDRRIAHLIVSHKGHRLMRLAKKHAIEDVREAFDALTDKELEQLHKLSQKMLEKTKIKE